MTNKNGIRFMWNGIKVGTGRLQRAFYMMSPLTNYPEKTISIYARDYRGFSAEVKASFTVENNSESMTDYFETDSIRVVPTHPLYVEVLKGLIANKEHHMRRAQKLPKGW